MTDPISDMLTRIRTPCGPGTRASRFPHSNMKLAIACDPEGRGVRRGVASVEKGKFKSSGSRCARRRRDARYSRASRW